MARCLKIERNIHSFSNKTQRSGWISRKLLLSLSQSKGETYLVFYWTPKCRLGHQICHHSYSRSRDMGFQYFLANLAAIKMYFYGPTVLPYQRGPLHHDLKLKAYFWVKPTIVIKVQCQWKPCDSSFYTFSIVPMFVSRVLCNLVQTWCSITRETLSSPEQCTDSEGWVSSR